MEKKIWSRPSATVEQFMPNEYIAACYSLQCMLFETDTYEKRDSGEIVGYDPVYRDDPVNYLHSNWGCGDPNNQVYRDGDQGAGVYEWSTVDGGTWLPCNNIVISADNLSAEWTTTSSELNRTWTHRGILISDTRPNHS